VVATAAVAVLAVAGCGDQATGAGGYDPLAGRTFLSKAVTRDGTPADLVESTRISLRFTDDGGLVANAGCNTLHGEVSTGQGRLDPTKIGRTEMGCDPLRHEQDLPGPRPDRGPIRAVSGRSARVEHFGPGLGLPERSRRDHDRP
jgi:heat shock protein HslJ